MNDIQQTLVRSLLKIGAGALVAHGYANQSQTEQITAAFVGLLSVLWGVFHRSGPAENQAQNVPITRPPSALPLLVLLAALAGVVGCASEAIKRGDIVRVEQRFFGIDVSQTPANGSPQVKLGFGSSVTTFTPASTNKLYTVDSGGTFSAKSTANPFAVDLDTADFTGENVKFWDGTNALASSGSESYRMRPAPTPKPRPATNAPAASVTAPGATNAPAGQ